MERRKFLRSVSLAAAGAAFAPHLAWRAAAHGRAPDLVLRDALIFDGSGRPPFEGDVAVTGGRILTIGKGLRLRGAEEVSLKGLALAPGFIDIHSHTDLVLLRHPLAGGKLRQGVTTEVTGQDGGSVGPWSEERFQQVRETYLRDGIEIDFRDVGGFLRHLDQHGAAVNIASMIGAGAVRSYVMGEDDRPPTPAELARMVAVVAEAVRRGACGVSSGLEYTPGAFAAAAELEALAAPLQGTGLPYASHLRNEDDRLLGAIEEAIGVGQRAGVPVQISHLKAQGQRNWWKTKDALELIENARSSGIDVLFDCYPYIAYSTGLSNLFPVWSRDGGTDAFLARLRDPALRPQLETAVQSKIAMLGSWDAVQIAGTSRAELAWARGRRLGQLAGERGVEPYELLLQLMIDDRARPGMVGFGMSEENVGRKLAHPLGMICSDGGAIVTTDGAPHPRNFGTFPRVLGYFCREKKLMPLELAIHKMTEMPARRLGFEGRGRVAEGAIADLVAFDPDRVGDQATFENPHQYPVGIPHVIVNGVFVLRDGDQTAARPGRAVRPSRSGGRT